MVTHLTYFDFMKIATVHIKAFNGFFLTYFGTGFLVRYYRELFYFPGSIFITNKENGFVRAFVCGCDNPSRFNRIFIKNNILYIFLYGIKASLLHPKFFLRLLTRGKDINHFPNKPNVISLLSIAVDPEFTGIGIGKILLKEFILKAKKDGYKYIYLTTDRNNNDSVNIFYQNNGFKLHGYYDSGNKRIMNEYLYTL